MNSALLTETRKLTTLRLPWVAPGIALAFSAVLGSASVLLLKAGQPLDVSAVALSVAEPVWFLVMVVAVLAGAGEFQHRTVRTTFLMIPRRGQVLAAKTTVAGAYGVLVTGASVAVATVACVVTEAVHGGAVHAGSTTAWAGVILAVALGGLWAVLASGLGVLTRSSALALTALLLWKFVGEGILPVVLRRPEIAHWTPSGTATTLVGLTRPTGTILLSAVVLVGYAALICTAAGLTLVKKDPA